MTAAALFSSHNLAVVFGLLGNVVSFLVFLSPTPTFYKIYKAKATRGFDPLPYSVALFSTMLTLYYGLIKESNGTLLITINSAGIIINSIYLTVFLIYASKDAKWKTGKLLLTFNAGLLGLIILLTSLLTHGSKREVVIGWICAACSVCFFASPLGVIRTVIKTKSVEFMPFWLSFSLMISAIMWFGYGFFIKDYFVATPNVLGLAFGITQMILYFIYKNSSKKSAKATANETLPTTVTADVSGISKVELEQVKVSGEMTSIEVKPEHDKLAKKDFANEDSDIHTIKQAEEGQFPNRVKVSDIAVEVTGIEMPPPLPVVNCAV